MCGFNKVVSNAFHIYELRARSFVNPYSLVLIEMVEIEIINADGI